MSGTTTLDIHGHSWAEAIETFIEFCNSALLQTDGRSGVTLDVMHGYGSTGTGGVLRSRLRGFLERNNDCIEFRTGEAADANPGHTLVTLLKMLPDTSELLAEQIWEYCTSAKSMSKITGAFRRHGQPKVSQALRTLEKQNRLLVVHNNAHKLFRAR